jgi:ketosteroid isomerase-like protein
MKSLLLLGTTLAITGIGQAQSPTIKDAMHHIYDGIEIAYNKKDINAVVSYLSHDYSWRMMDGKKLNLGQARNDIKEQLNSTQSGKWTVTIQNLMGAGPVASAVVQYHFKGVMLDSSKQPYRAEITSIEQQTWIRGADGWKQTQDSILSQSSRNEGLTTRPNVKDSGEPIINVPEKQGNNNNSQDQQVPTGP